MMMRILVNVFAYYEVYSNYVVGSSITYDGGIYGGCRWWY